MKKADYFEAAEGKKVRCFLCPHHCLISDGKSGICGARANEGGELYSLNYGVVSGLSFDPIEKKPFYHYYPGSQILSIGTVGCNMHCLFCQNYSISRFFEESEGQSLDSGAKPEELVQLVKKNSGRDFGGIAYTYSEPMVWYEFVYDTSALIKDAGYKNVLVSNGLIEQKPLAKLMPLIDAANIDLKAFTEANYKKLGGKLKPVQETIAAMFQAGVHIELTTLVVTKFNDNLDELEALVKWAAGLDKNIPLHFSRYHPQYRYHEPPTDHEFLKQIKQMAEVHLNYVYLGNTGDESDSFCPNCKTKLVERSGYSVKITGLHEGSCKKCGRKADFRL